MFGEGKNLRDNGGNDIKDTLSLSVPYHRTNEIKDAYPKLNKLVTALYIVTDIIDKDEPMRAKLRTLGANILSDITFNSRTNLIRQVDLVLSFLEISLAVNLISEMNGNILKKEFIELSKILEEERGTKPKEVNNTWLKEFLEPQNNLPAGREETREKKVLNEGVKKSLDSAQDKKERREEILRSIRELGGQATITEILNHNKALFSKASGKTLQRELVSMVAERILTKEGEKRWSKYMLPVGQNNEN